MDRPPAALAVSLQTTPLLDIARRTPLLVAIAAGLLFGDVFAGTGTVPPAWAVAGLAGAGTLLLFMTEPAIARIGVVLLTCTLGYVAAARVYRPSFAVDDVVNVPQRVPLILEATLVADPEPLGDRIRFWLAAERVDDGWGWRRVQGQVLLTVPKVGQTWNPGDRLRAAVSLRRPRNFGNPGEFNLEAYWARRGVYVTAFADDDAAFERIGHVAQGLAEPLARWRRGVGQLFRRTLPEPQAAVLSALIIGTKMAQPHELRAAFSRAGVSHVLSISGLHVGLVAAAGYAVFRWLLARSRWLLLTANVPKLAAGVSVIPVLLYAGIAGTNVATTRSVIMVLVFAGAVLVDRQRHLIASLALAVILILATSPGAALDISFQLSFLAVLGLVLGLDRFWPWWKRWEELHLVRLRGWRARLWRPVMVYFVVSLSAMAATAPLTAFHFNQVSFIAIAANAVVVPLLGSAAVVLGLVAAMGYVLWEPLAHGCVLLAGPVVQLGVWLVERCAAVPFAAVRVVTPTTLELALMYAALFATVRLSGRARRLSLAAVSFLTICDIGWWYAARYHRRDLQVTFLSVGQGESAVVELPGGEVMMVDAGGAGSAAFDIGERVIAPFLWGRKIAHVDYLVLSHSQWDHYGGMAFLAGNFSPREFWSNGSREPAVSFSRLEQALRDNGVRWVALHRGDRRRLGAVEAVIESPAAPDADLSVNDQSLVVSLGFRGRRALFTGDVESGGEARMVASAGGTLASAVLKVPHHGSDTSSSPRFLDAVAPQVAVISDAFRNPFGFPSAAVLQRYAARHCAIVRTDLDGAVQVRIMEDGRIETARRGSWRGG